MTELTNELDDRSSAGIAAAMGRLIRSGAYVAGDRLPTVREVAKSLRVSPATVNEAWRGLAAVGVIETRGRLGTFVVDRRAVTGPRYARISASSGRFDLDLSTGAPDIDLLPDIGQALSAVGVDRLASTYHSTVMVPELEKFLRSSWPFPPGALTLVDGALDGLDRVGWEIIRLGDRVLVENPTFAPLLDLLERLGAKPVPLPLDSAGLSPDALVTALADAQPSALFVQPRAHNPTGASMTRDRARELAAVLAAAPEVIVVEDDHAGDIAVGADISVGEFLPDRTVHVRSYSKSHGPDLRIAVLGGSTTVVEAVAERRLLGPGWTSRLLQNVLARLLTSPTGRLQIDHARQTYAARQRVFAAALAEHGIDVVPGDGINVWVPVADEQAALVTLAAAGVKVAPGSPFVVTPLPDSDHIRVTLSLPDQRIPEVARWVADAAHRHNAGRSWS